MARADELIKIIGEKLLANRNVLEKSLRFGRISWRLGKNGQIEVELEPKI